MTPEETETRKQQRANAMGYIKDQGPGLWRRMFEHYRLDQEKTKIFVENFTSISRIAETGEMGGLGTVLDCIDTLFACDSLMFEKIFMAGLTLLFRGIITSLKYSGFDATFLRLGLDNINAAVYNKIKLVIDNNISAADRVVDLGGGKTIISPEALEQSNYVVAVDSWYNMLSGLVHSYDNTERFFYIGNNRETIALKRYEILNLCFVLLASSESRSTEYYRANPMRIANDPEFMGILPAVRFSCNALELLDRLVDRLYILTLE